MSLRIVEKYFKWNEQRRHFSPVMWRREILPQWLTFSLNDTVLPFTTAAAGVNTRPVSMVQPYFSVDGNDRSLGHPFEVRSLVFQDSTDGTLAANFTVRMKEMGEVREFSNGPIHVRTMFGTGQLPALLREPYFFMSEHNIQFQLAKVAGGATTTRLYLCGAQYYPWAPELLRDSRSRDELQNTVRMWQNRRRFITPYWLTTDVPNQPAAVLASAALDTFAKVGDDGHFEVFGHCAVSTGAFSVEISEVKTKQTLMNGAITNVNGVGDARFPTIYPTPYLIPAGFRLRLRFTDLSAAPNTIHFTLFGRKIYSPIGQTQEIIAANPIPTPADSPTLFVPAPL